MMMIIWQSFVVSHSLLVGHLGCLIFFFFFIFKKVALRGFLGSPVVKIPRFQCGGAGSVLVQGTETLRAVW